MKRVFIQAGYLLLILNQIIASKEVVTINTTVVTIYNTTTVAAANIKNEPHKAEGHIPTIVENSFRSNPSKCKIPLKSFN